MNADERRRFEALKVQTTSARLIEELLGVDPCDSYLEGRFRSWMRQSVLWASEKFAAERVDRNAFELFLTHHRLLPFRYAAARLGMHSESLKPVLVKLDLRGDIFLDRDALKAEVIDETMVRDIYRNFSSLQAVMFSDHDEFCTYLHAAIETELRITVKPLRCTTAAIFGEDRFAWQYCAISREGLSTRYEVRLDLNNKPMRLRADVCSLLFYARHRDVLTPYLFGQAPEDADIERLSAA